MNTSVLIYSCDKYSDVWGPFFTLFFRYWDCPYQVYLATETEQCLLPEVKTINTEGTWTERMQQAVREIPTKYVIGMCEDMFFRRRVHQEVIENCLMYMEFDDRIGCFNFEKEYERGIKLIPSDYLDFAEKPQGDHFQKSCQPSLWRKDYLIDMLEGKMDAWHWEWLVREYPLKHYIWNGLLSETVFDYGYKDNKWFGVHNGKWIREDVVPLFEKEHIDVDYSERGFYGEV